MRGRRAELVCPCFFCFLFSRPIDRVRIATAPFVIVVGLLFSGASGDASADVSGSADLPLTETQKGAPTSWSDCVTWAAQNSPEIKAAEANYRSAREQTQAGFGGFLFPNINATAGYNHTETRTATPGVAGYNNNSYTDADGTSALLNFSENVFNGFADQARYQQAKENEKTALANLLIAKAKISADLKSAFAGLLFARESLILTDKIYQRRKQNLALVELRYEGGRENKGSVLLYQAYLKQADYNRLIARDLIDSASATFGKVIGLDPAAVENVHGQVPMSLPPDKVDYPSIIEGNPTRLGAVATEAYNKAGITLARSALLPVLAVTANVGKFDTSWFPQNDKWSIGLGLTIPIFNGGKDYYTYRAAQDTLTNATANLELAERLLFTQLKQAYYAFQEAVAKESVDQTFLEAARIRANIGRNKYDNGLLTFEDWDLIETDLINRETNVLASSRDRIIQESNWEQTQGKGVIP